MRLSKAWMGIVLAIVMLFAAVSFVACGSSEDGDTDEIKVIKMWLHLSEAEDEGKVYSALADSFNEANIQTTDGRTIQVRLEFCNSSDTLSTKINAEILTGGLPDVVAVDAPNISSYVDAGILTNVSDYFTEEVLADYVDSVIEQGTIDGGLYALSSMDAPTGLYYNKDLLKQVGYSDEDFGTVDDPWNWEDLMEAMQKLKAAGLAYQIDLNLGFGGSEGNMYLYSPLVYSAGGTFCDENEKVTGYLNGEAALNGLKMLEAFFDTSEGTQWYYDGSNDDSFPQGQVAFQIYGPWEIENINENYASFASSYDIMPMPVYVDENGNEGTVAGGCGSWCLGVTTNTKDAYAAARVVEYFTSAYASELFYDSIGTFPTHVSSYNTISDFESGPAASLAEILMEAATPRPKMVNYPKLTDAFANCISYIETMYGSGDYDLSAYVTRQAATVDA